MRQREHVRGRHRTGPALRRWQASSQGFAGRRQRRSARRDASLSTSWPGGGSCANRRPGPSSAAAASRTMLARILEGGDAGLPSPGRLGLCSSPLTAAQRTWASSSPKPASSSSSARAAFPAGSRVSRALRRTSGLLDFNRNVFHQTISAVLAFCCVSLNGTGCLGPVHRACRFPAWRPCLRNALTARRSEGHSAGVHFKASGVPTAEARASGSCE